MNRLDKKNWTPTPRQLSERIASCAALLAKETDALVLLGQVDQPETGVLTARVLEAIRDISLANPKRLIFADNRHSLRGFPPVIFKMNSAELAALTGTRVSAELPEIVSAATDLARKNGRPVFVTLAVRGIIGVSPAGESEHAPSLPVRGEIDIVGAGDAVTANLTSALAAGATMREALELANAAASIVVHQLGTTGTASVAQMRELLFDQPAR